MKTLRDKAKGINQEAFQEGKSLGIMASYKHEDVREAILQEREDLRNLIFELAKVYGSAILYYNKKIDDIHSNRFGNFEK